MSRKIEKTKNDIAWENLFDKYKILEKVSNQGYFEIKSTQINEERESRLMAKFDHQINLPNIFQENNLSILPVSRSKYIIGYFDTHEKIKYSRELEVIPFNLPERIESIDYTNLYSEASALNCAFNAGIINDLVNEETLFTVSGRMSSDVFSFNIRSTINKSQCQINVENSQCEIDGGFESDNYFILIETKNYSVDDFLVRQLYYPYRLWLNKISKKVIPVLMTYSNDIFSFFIYEFKNNLDYNSLVLVEQKNYKIAEEEIQLNDVSSIFSRITLMTEPKKIPFPQANRFGRVVDLLSLLVTKDLTKEEIAESYQFDIRQARYYTDAGRYLGLINKSKDRNTGEVAFCLSDEGKSILKMKPKTKFLALIKKILQYKVFYKAFESTINSGMIPRKEAICEIMSASNLNIDGETIRRRSSTVRKWIEWIWSQIV